MSLLLEGGEQVEQVARRSCGCLEVFRVRLDSAQNNLVLWETSLPMAKGAVTRGSLRSFPTKAFLRFYDSKLLTFSYRKINFKIVMAFWNKEPHFSAYTQSQMPE